MTQSNEKVLIVEESYIHPNMPNLIKVCKPEFCINDSIINLYIQKILADRVAYEYILKLEVYYDYYDYLLSVDDLHAKINSKTIISVSNNICLVNSNEIVLASHIYYVYREAKTEFLNLCLFVGKKKEWDIPWLEKGMEYAKVKK